MAADGFDWSKEAVRFFLLKKPLPSSSSTKNSGTKHDATSVDASIPPITPVPIECRLLAPAPLAVAMGRQPRINASEVITIGRSRSRAASIAASAGVIP